MSKVKHWLCILDQHGLSIYSSHPTIISLFFIKVTFYKLNLWKTASINNITSLMAGLYASLQEVILQWKLLLKMSRWTIKLAKTIHNLPWIYPQHNQLILKSFKLTQEYLLLGKCFAFTNWLQQSPSNLLIILPPLAMCQPPVAINLASGLKEMICI